MFSQSREVSVTIPPWGQQQAIESDESVVFLTIGMKYDDACGKYVGIVRSDKRLERAKRRIDMINREIE
jgi:L-aspartate oxidase